MRLPFSLIMGCLAIELLIPLNSAKAQEKTGKSLLLALEESLQDVIKQTEPSVACILVSRSSVYKNQWSDFPPADQPGKLGAFDPSGKPMPTMNNQMFRGRRGMNREAPDDVGARRYDLSFSGYIPEAYGSGLVIDGEKLLVLTNYHVIRDATKIYVRLPGEKGSYADIHAADPQKDLAVLSLLDKSIKPLKPVKFGNGGDAKKGQFVVAIANPYASGFRDGSPSASWGIVSNIQRRAAANANEAAGSPLLPSQKDEGLTATFTVSTFIQTDAQILAGSSGGALVNLKGEVIGMLSSRAGLSGMEGVGGFAMPIDKDFKKIIEQLREGKEFQHGFLGISPDYDNKPGEGALIGRLTSGGPAQLAGLNTRDCIVAVNGTPIRDFEDLVLAVSSLPAGSEARIELRDRHPAIVTVKLTKTFVPGILASNRPKPVRGIRVDYQSAVEIERAKKVLQAPVISARGVGVSEVASGSPAEEARLYVGDIITEVNGQSVSEPDEFYKEASKIPAAKALVLTVAGARGIQRIEVP